MSKDVGHRTGGNVSKRTDPAPTRHRAVPCLVVGLVERTVHEVVASPHDPVAVSRSGRGAVRWRRVAGQLGSVPSGHGSLLIVFAILSAAPRSSSSERFGSTSSHRGSIIPCASSIPKRTRHHPDVEVGAAVAPAIEVDPRHVAKRQDPPLHLRHGRPEVSGRAAGEVGEGVDVLAGREPHRACRGFRQRADGTSSGRWTRRRRSHVRHRCRTGSPPGSPRLGGSGIAALLGLAWDEGLVIGECHWGFFPSCVRHRWGSVIAAIQSRSAVAVVGADRACGPRTRTSPSTKSVIPLEAQGTGGGRAAWTVRSGCRCPR